MFDIYGSARISGTFLHKLMQQLRVKHILQLNFKRYIIVAFTKNNLVQCLFLLT